MMVSFSIEEVSKVGNVNYRDDLLDLSKISKGRGPSPMEVEEEDEEEDVDFNPFLKDLPSPEASSSLSSENECLDGCFISKGKNCDKQFAVDDEVQNFATRDPSCSVDEIVMEISGSHSEARQKPVSNDPKFMFITQPEIASNCNQSQGATAAELSCKEQHQKHTVDLDGEDAICTRTRARYSLASFTLDELETFLQETDDEDDLQNVDDEEEYKKFLAAVLLGGDGDGVNQQNPSAEDEDEDNDADFEIELEEALESDPDEITGDHARKDVVKWAGRRPETRQNKRQKVTVKSAQKLLVLEKRPLRPLLPSLPNQPVASYANYGKTLTAWNAPRSDSVSSGEETNLVNGFTTQQIGQLYCLIHEHVQLLIQVFSLCILDFSRPHIASQVQELIFEMLHKRKEVLGWKNVSYPSICFCPPYSCSSVPDEIPRFFTQSNPGSSPFFEANNGYSSQLPCQMAASYSTHPQGKHENVPSGQGQVVEGSFWVPSVSRPVLTTLDVAPLDLVEKYFEDIDTVILEYRRRHVESSSSSTLQFEPLFPFSSVPSFQGVNEPFLGNISSVITSSIRSLPKQQPPKKTLAATLVESTKKQSVALVPTEVAKLAKNFFPLFNPALFPHKPPPGGVVNRVLFTDAEDELLALGMMEFNTDWKAIQQRFLPCKSKHQIFVRQKNQCSSKASENPIKAVRRMKTSPLTAEELSRIQEGLKVFKSDWLSVWRFIVPYRDPSLLPRQWRIALGTHRSYKQDPAGRERRRLYESNRRKRKAMNLTSWQQAFERENGISETTAPGTSNSMGKNKDNAVNTCVNDGILADCREGTPGENPCSNLKERHLQSNASLQKPPCNEQQSGEIRSEEARPLTGNVNFYPLPEYLHHPSSLSNTARHAASTRSPIYCRPYRGRSRRTHSPYMVKLAPNLPPVNLPPSVRVVSQSVFRDSQLGAPSRTFVARGNGGATGREISDPKISQVSNSGSPKSNGSDMQKASGNSIPAKSGLTPITTEGCRVNDSKGAEWGSPISDHHMHPLLFQAPDDGRLSYYPLDCSNSNSNSFSFFSGNQPQLNLSLFHNPPSELLADCFTQLLKSKGSTSTPSGIDFHPLLQRSDDLSAEPMAACPYTQLSVHSRGNYVGMTTRSKSKRPRGESADLDLDMHLSLTSNEDKVRGNGNVEFDRAGSMMNSLGLRSMPDTLRSNNASGQDEFPTNDGGYNGDEIDEQFHPEIVMEQEELSDSDDEIEENVEFECEEMTDSDGEDGSGCQLIVPVKNKFEYCLQDSNLVPEENDTEADHGDDEPCYKPNGDLLENDTTPSLELDLASQMKDDASRTSWLSLDSCASESALLAGPNQKEVIIREGSYPSNRSYEKKRRTKSGLEAKRQLLPGPLAAPASRKPQKRAGRRNANSNDISAGESTPGCDGK